MKAIIFGYGFTGQHLQKYIPDALKTELPDKCSQDEIPFDFHAPETWDNLPDFDTAIITFKMTKPALASKFAELLKGKTVILLSSARNLLNSQPDQIISEESPLSQKERALSEAPFLNISTILYLGLIWGDERNPTKWIYQNRIKNGEKFINFIHVDDLCKIIIGMITNYKPGQNYLVSDGQPIKWKDIANKIGVSLNLTETGLESRRFNTEKLKAFLPESFQFKRP
ncbi:MAG: hypothetical protein NE330_23590 [Lentisphaeraceae bacterium]|nr:hypothetical protein [Lentisphaeraceae bacterium]